MNRATEAFPSTRRMIEEIESTIIEVIGAAAAMTACAALIATFTAPFSIAALL